MKIIGVSIIWIVTIALSLLYVKKVSVQIRACKASALIVKIVCFIILPFLLLAAWLYEPLWEQICLLAGITDETAHFYKMHFWWAFLLVTLLVTTAWCVRLLRRNKGNEDNKPLPSGMNDCSPKDAPIRKWAEDILHRRPFVEVLKTAILRADVRNGAEYIGVFGEWGTGKTSVVNLLKCDMKADKSAVFVDFDPWDFRSADDAVDGFMRVIADVAFKGGAYAVGDSFSDYLQVLRLRKTDADYGSVGLMLEFVRWKFYHIFLNVRRHKISLKRHLRLMPRRIVVILDDLERMSQSDVSEILRTIKTNLNLPNLVFLIVSSKRHLLKAAANYLGDMSGRNEEDEKECLLKIVQYQFSIPIVPTSDIMAFFKNRLRKVLEGSGYSYGDYDVESDNGDGYETVTIFVRTLRSALLLSNSVWEALAYLKKVSPDGALNIHVGDLVALCAIRLVDEKFYKALPDLFSRFMKIYTERLLLDAPEMPEDEFSSWMNNNITPSCREADTAFLKKRLGLVESQNKSGAKVYLLTGLLSDRQEMLSQYRLGSPECFREYFFDFSSTRHAPKEMLVSFIDRTEKEENAEDIFEMARKQQELPNLILSLEGLPQFSSDKITLHYFRQLFILASSDFNDCEYTYLGHDGFPDTIYTAIWRCISRYCGKYRQSAEFSNTMSNIVYVGRLLFDAIKETPEPHVLWRILSYEHGNYEKDKQILQSYNDIVPSQISQSSLFSWGQYEALQAIYLNKIEKYQQCNRLFADREFFDLLRAWNICLLAKNDEQRYKTFQTAVADCLKSISNVINLTLFLTQSEVHFNAVYIGDIKFLPIDCAGAMRLWGEGNLSRISETFSANDKILNQSQRATAVALKYVIDNKFDPVVCDNEHQITFIKEWAKQNANNSTVQ